MALDQIIYLAGMSLQLSDPLSDLLIFRGDLGDPNNNDNGSCYQCYYSSCWCSVRASTPSDSIIQKFDRLPELVQLDKDLVEIELERRRGERGLELVPLLSLLASYVER